MSKKNVQNHENFRIETKLNQSNLTRLKCLETLQLGIMRYLATSFWRLLKDNKGIATEPTKTSNPQVHWFDLWPALTPLLADNFLPLPKCLVFKNETLLFFFYSNLWNILWSHTNPFKKLINNFQPTINLWKIISHSLYKSFTSSVW